MTCFFFVLFCSTLCTCMYVYPQVQCMCTSPCAMAWMCMSDLVLSFYRGRPADPTHVIKRGGWWPAERSYQPSLSMLSFSFLPQAPSRDHEGTWHQLFSPPVPLTSPAFLMENSRTVPDPGHAGDIAGLWLQPDIRERDWTNFGGVFCCTRQEHSFYTYAWPQHARLATCP